MEVLVYDPRYVNQLEVEKIIAALKEKGVDAISLVHMNKDFRPFYIESSSEVKK